MGISRAAPFRVWALAFVVFVNVLAGLRASTDYVSPPWRAESFAGYLGTGHADGAAASATFSEPSGLARDAAGNLYVTDTQNSTIRKLTPGGVVSTLAGTPGLAGIADGPVAGARFNLPFGLVAASDGTLYIADTGNHLIRRITPEGVVSTLAGTAGQSGSTNATGSAARFSSPTALALDATAGLLYVADTGNNIIRRLVIATGAVTTLAGTPVTTGSTVNGTGATARFHGPIALALNAAGTTLYVADQTGQTLRQVAISGGSGTVTTLAGLAGTAGSADGTGGAGGSARFNEPKGLVLNAAGTFLYVAEANGCRLRAVQLSNSQVTTLAGSYQLAGSFDATGAAARFSQPAGLAYDSAGGGRLLVADVLNAQLRALDLTTLAVTTLAGPPLSRGSTDGVGGGARFRVPRHLARDSAGNLYVADRDNHTLRKITPAGAVTTLAGLAGTAATTNGTGAAARFNQPVGVAVTSDGSSIYVSELAGHVIRHVTAGGVVTTLAGAAGVTGSTDSLTGTAARFNQPAGLALDASGNVYVADFGNHTIRRVTPGGAVITFAGTAGSLGSADGAGTTVARFASPFGLAFDSSGNLYVADSLNQTIRRVTPAAVVSTYAGAAGQVGSADSATATSARFFYPYAVAVDAAGLVYVADYANHLIRRIEPSGNRAVRTLAGTPAAPGGVDGIASAARFRNPQGIAVASDGQTLFVSDTENSTVRRLTLAPFPEITSAATASGTVGVPLATYTITGTLFPTVFGALGLPPGLTVNTSTGAITGSPVIAGIWDTTLTAQNAAGIGTGTVRFTIGKGSATIQLASLSQPYDGTPKTPVATTQPGSYPVVFTYNGSSTAPSAYGSYTLVATIDHPNYQGSAVATFQITAPTFWNITTLPLTGAQLPASPSGLALGPDGNLYIADSTRHVIFKRTPAGAVTVFAGGLGLPGYANATGTNARFDTPTGLAFDSTGNLYVSDSGNNRIRVITTGGAVSLAAGDGTINGYDGTGDGAAFYLPAGLAFAPDGSLYIADSGNSKVRRYLPSTGYVSTVNNASEEPLSFDTPTGLAFGSTGALYVSAANTNNLWRITLPSTVELLAGNGGGASGDDDGTGSNARFFFPTGLALGPDANLYVTDTLNHTLRRVTSGGAVTTLAGLAGDFDTTDGFGPVARFSGPSALAIADPATGALFIADTDNGLIRLASPPPVVPVIAPPPVITLTQGTAPSGYAYSATGAPTAYSATGLPPGLTLHPTTGALTGIPTASGIYPVTLQVTNALTTVSSSFDLTINAPSWSVWSATVFNSTQLANSAVSGPAADPDGDGVPNLFEYLQDRDPLLRDTSPPVPTLTNGYLTLAHDQLRAAPGWQIVPERSTDLQTWQRGSTYLEVLQTEILDARRKRTTIRTNPALGLPPRVFIRLMAEPAP